MGILEETYLWAVPFPGLFGGNRRAIMEVDRGITVVSSAYSRNRCQRWCHEVASGFLTFIGILIIDMQIKITSVSQFVKRNDLPLQVKNCYSSPIKRHPSMLLLTLEFEKDRRRHTDAVFSLFDSYSVRQLIILDPTKKDRQDTS